MTASRDRFRALAAVFAALIVICGAGRSRAQFVYVNNNVGTTNSVSAFAYNAAGALTAVTGSPFATGGGGSFSPNVGSVDVIVVGM